MSLVQELLSAAQAVASGWLLATQRPVLGSHVDVWHSFAAPHTTPAHLEGGTYSTVRFGVVRWRAVATTTSFSALRIHPKFCASLATHVATSSFSLGLVSE